ncbi:MAG: SDR family NAD(P)-dependent oxidoreductase [Deltaproteobacteria bacterium]|nr:SDR family NAD(P)-dependent oxidoreductase [Deltaproteobacteria bacterium]
MQWLENEVAVVTGAGSGIGKAVVKRFIEEGAQVVAFDLSAERLKTLKEECAEVAIVQGDVRSVDDNRKAVATAVAQFGKLSVFVGNAGIHDGRRKLDGLSDTELANGFDEVFGVNIRGYLLGAKAALPELKKTKGRMVFTLSTSSFYVGGGVLYVASKHAALGLMRQLANELAPDIRVNGVAPSGTATNLRTAPSLMGNNQAPASPVGAGRSAGVANNILNFNIAPEDHASAYVLLASSQSKTMTGTVLHTDAGRGVMTFSGR